MIPARGGPRITPTLKYPEDNRNREPLEDAETPFEKDRVLEIEGLRQESRRESPFNGVVQAIGEPVGYEFGIS